MQLQEQEKCDNLSSQK